MSSNLVCNHTHDLSESHYTVIWFCSSLVLSYDYRPNWTTFSPITIINHQLNGEGIQCCSMWQTPAHPSPKTDTWSWSLVLLTWYKANTFLINWTLSTNSVDVLPQDGWLLMYSNTKIMIKKPLGFQNDWWSLYCKAVLTFSGLKIIWT